MSVAKKVIKKIKKLQIEPLDLYSCNYCRYQSESPQGLGGHVSMMHSNKKRELKKIETKMIVDEAWLNGFAYGAVIMTIVTYVILTMPLK